MTKWLVIFLLLGNVVVFGWRFNENIRAETIAAAGAPAIAAGTASLRLISELPKLPPKREPRRDLGEQLPSDDEAEVEVVDLTTEINSEKSASNACLSIGPIPDKARVDALRNWLRDSTAVMHTRAETVRERRFFWVYLEPASDAKAQERLADLKLRGVTDYMLIRRGGLKNAISLGLFRSQDSVNRRLAEMGKQGYKPVVVPKFEKTENYWIKATLAADVEVNLAIPDDLRGEAEVEPSTCATTTARNDALEN